MPNCLPWSPISQSTVSMIYCLEIHKVGCFVFMFKKAWRVTAWHLPWGLVPYRVFNDVHMLLRLPLVRHMNGKPTKANLGSCKRPENEPSSREKALQQDLWIPAMILVQDPVWTFVEPLGSRAHILFFPRSEVLVSEAKPERYTRFSHNSKANTITYRFNVQCKKLRPFPSCDSEGLYIVIFYIHGVPLNFFDRFPLLACPYSAAVESPLLYLLGFCWCQFNSRQL